VLPSALIVSAGAARACTGRVWGMGFVVGVGERGEGGRAEWVLCPRGGYTDILSQEFQNYY
jgi:hypothetical protein